MFLLLVLLLSACVAPMPSYDDQLRAYVGLSAEGLYDRWGLPNNEFYVDDNTKEVTYVKINPAGDSEPYAGQMYYPAMSTEAFPGPNPDNISIYYCKISFIIRNNIVSSYNYNGDDCVGSVLSN